MNDDETQGRKLAFKCCVPSNVSTCSDDNLRVALVGLKNALANVTVCMRRIERELERRGAPSSILAAIRQEIPDDASTSSTAVREVMKQSAP
ncbi:MAG: hypothetical protein P1Q69_11510 [Candidatus Thorarchaeota archaeon]|nr:hypothetical protein [Candidatus Thorarchaeota archaeon]